MAFQFSGRSFAAIAGALFFTSLASAQTAQPPAPPPPPAAPAQPSAGAATGSLSETLQGEAKADYDAGKVLYVDGDFAGALLKFTAAYEKSKDPRLLWNMAAAEKSLRHYARAIDMLDRYLAEGGDKLSVQDREDALSLKSAMTPFIGELLIQVNEPGATISVDGEEVGVSPLSQALRLDIGSRRIHVTKAGFQPFEGVESVRGGGEAVLTINLEKAINEGTLVIHAGVKDEIRVDGKLVATGTYKGNIKAGGHHVVVTAPGKLPYESDVLVQVGQSSTLHVRLQDDRAAAPDSSGVPAWVWITGGVVLAGLSAGAVILLTNNEEEPPAPINGTIQPGIVQLPFMR